MVGAEWNDDSYRALIGVSADGLALLDETGHFVALNDSASLILGSDDLAGRLAPFDTGAVTGRMNRAVWHRPDGRQRELDYKMSPVPGGHAVWFSDVTEMLRQAERLTAIARTASSVAGVFNLASTLDALAREVAMTASIAAVQILALGDPEEDVQVLGMAGFGEAADFTERLAACRALGARPLFTEAFIAGEPVVVPHRKATHVTDAAWQPLSAIMSQPDWDTFVSMPLVARGRAVGVINAYYRTGEDPGPDSLAFLRAMADQAAIAIDTVSLLDQARSRARAEARRGLARDLHDSVVQQLFSMRLQAEALRAQIGQADATAIGKTAGDLAELSRAALGDLRALVLELRPVAGDLLEAVRSRAAEVAGRTGLEVSVRADPGVADGIDAGAAEDLYRILQEALHNVVKHARATKAEIHLARRGRELCAVVSDNGVGQSASPRPGASATGSAALGIVSMRERAELWGGKLAAGPGERGGWSVTVRLPLDGSR